LLAWGWTVSLFVLPELLCRRYISPKQYAEKPWLRHLAAAGGVANVFMLIAANLIGFAIGTEGVKYMLGEMLTSLNGQFALRS
jgi:D-alanyl-lipoteichoic acid acyltransferase DltB (MBOAT superfamily)